MLAFKSKNSFLLLLMSVFFFISITAFDPFISLYAQSLNMTVDKIGLLIGATGVVAICVRFPVGVFGDRLKNRRTVMQVGLLFTLVLWTIAVIFPSFFTLIGGKVADGLTGATWVIYTALFVHYVGSENAVRATGLLTVSSSIGTLIGSTIGGIVAKKYGYSSTFVVAIVGSIIALFISLFLTDYCVESEKSYSIDDLKSQLKDRKLWVLGLLAAVALLIPYSTKDTFTPLIAKDLGADPVINSQLFNIHLLMQVAGAAIIGSSLIKRFNVAWLSAIGAIGQGVCAILIPFSPNLTVLFILQALAGFFFCFHFTVLMGMAAAGVSDDKRATRIGIYQSIYSLGIFIGPMALGQIMKSVNIYWGFASVSIVCMISAFFIIALFRKANVVDLSEVDADV